MKRIEATVRPIFYGVVKEALQGLGIHVMTVSRVETIDRRGTLGDFEFTDARSSVRIDTIVADDLAVNARDAIISVMQGKGRSIGRISISTVDKVTELGTADCAEDIESPSKMQ